MLDLTQQDPATMETVKFGDGDEFEFDCFELLEKVQKTSLEATKKLRKDIDKDAPKIVAIYGKKTPNLPDTEDNKSENWNIDLENSDRATAICADEAVNIKMDAFRTVLDRKVSLTFLVRLIVAVEKKAGVFGAPKKK